MKLAVAAVLALATWPVSALAQDSLATPPPAAEPTVQEKPAEAATVPEMEPGVIYLVEGDSLRKLEGIPLDKDKSVGGLGALLSVATMTDMMGEQFWGVLEGTTSEMPIKDPQPQFRVQLEKTKAMAIRLGKFAKAGKKRRARIDTRKPVDFFVGKYRVKLEFTRLGEDLYQLSPVKPLKPGEYALCFSGNGPAVDFTVVDEKKAKE